MMKKIGNETHLMLHADPAKTFDEQLESLHSALGAFVDSQEKACTPVFMRYFLSDAANQEESVRTYLSESQACAVSIVEQPPLDGTKVALWVYLMEDVEVSQSAAGLWEVRQGDYTPLWNEFPIHR